MLPGDEATSGHPGTPLLHGDFRAGAGSLRGPAAPVLPQDSVLFLGNAGTPGGAEEAQPAPQPWPQALWRLQIA